MTAISVIVPTFNRASLLAETLDAILAQTRAPDEVIVVDDGSTDDTPAVLRRYGGRVRPIRIPNGGDLVARNTGLRAAQGGLVAFCDSDDLWMPGFLAEMAAQWRAVPNLVACYGNFRVLRPDGTLSSRSKFDDAPDRFWAGSRETGPEACVFEQPVVARLLRFQPFFTSCMMASRRALVEAGGWDEGVSRLIGCDFATALRMAATPPVGVVHRPLVAIRKHPGNYSGNTEAMNLGDARVLEYVLQTRPDLQPLAAAIRKSAAERRRAALDSAFARRDFAAVREIEQLLPRGLGPGKQRLKRIIAALPPPLNAFTASLASRVGRGSAACNPSIVTPA